MSSERALEKAAEEHARAHGAVALNALNSVAAAVDDEDREAAKAIVAAYLDSLLGELPEEAVEVQAAAIWKRAPGVAYPWCDAGHLKPKYRALAHQQITAVLRSLRSGLKTGGGG